MAHTSDEIIDVLAGVSLFADVPRAQLEALAHRFEEDSIPAGQRIFRRGFGGSDFRIIVDGQAIVEIDGEKVATLSRGEFFGEVSILLGDHPTADVTAVTPLLSLSLPASELQNFLFAYPQVMYRILQAEARRLRSALQWVS